MNQLRGVDAVDYFGVNAPPGIDEATVEAVWQQVLGMRDQHRTDHEAIPDLADLVLDPTLVEIFEEMLYAEQPGMVVEGDPIPDAGADGHEEGMEQMEQPAQVNQVVVGEEDMGDGDEMLAGDGMAVGDDGFLVDEVVEVVEQPIDEAEGGFDFIADDEEEIEVWEEPFVDEEPFADEEPEEISLSGPSDDGSDASDD